MSARQKRPIHASDRKITLVCAEPLRPAACCVADSLSVHGFEVELCTGVDARDVLARGRRAARSGLRVVCVPRELDRKTDAKLRRALDPDHRGDLLIVALRTPRVVIEAIEDWFGEGGEERRAKRASTRASRAILAHPTLVERPIDPRGFGFAGLAGLATTGAIVALAVMFVGTGPTKKIAAAGDAAPGASAGGLDDGTVLSSARGPASDDEPWLLENDESMAVPRRAARGRRGVPATPAPLERRRRPIASAIAPGSLQLAPAMPIPGVLGVTPARDAEPIDPFAGE